MVVKTSIGRGFVKQYAAGLAACFSLIASGSCFGWVTPILDYLLSPDSEIPMTPSQSSWMVSIIEVGSLLSPLPASFMADRWGRHPSILLTGPLFFFSWVIILVWPSIEILYLSRTIQGIAVGIVFTVVPLYLSEISSPMIRGSVCSLFQISWTLGHLVEYCIGPYLSYRTYTCVTASLPLIFMVLFYLQPETPHYLLMKKKESEAALALARLRDGDAESINEELQAMIHSVNSELSSKASWRDIVRTSADRRSLYIVVGLGVIRILSGLIGVLAYSTQTFSFIPRTSTTEDSLISKIVTPDNITILLGVVLFISSFFPTVIADLSGRRKLLICSSLGASVNSFLAGGYFYLNSLIDLAEYSWFPVIAIVLYCLFVTLGLASVAVMYQSEMFLANTRGLASSISAINITINSFVILKFYKVIADSFGVYSILWIFSLICLFGLFWIYFTVPETKGRTFFEIRQELQDDIQSKKSKTSVIPAAEVASARTRHI